MAKNAFPMMKNSGGLGKIVGALMLAVCAIALVNDPIGTASTLRKLFDAVVTFVSAVAG